MEAKDILVKVKEKLAGSEYQKLLEKQRETEGLKAAIKDPKTGKVYSGWTHQAAIDSVPKGDSDTWGRLSSEWDQMTDNVGFVTKSGKFINRDEAESKWGILTIEDLKDLRKKSASKKLTVYKDEIISRTLELTLNIELSGPEGEDTSEQKRIQNLAKVLISHKGQLTFFNFTKGLICRINGKMAKENQDIEDFGEFKYNGGEVGDTQEPQYHI